MPSLKALRKSGFFLLLLLIFINSFFIFGEKLRFHAAAAKACEKGGFLIYVPSFLVKNADFAFIRASKQQKNCGNSQISAPFRLFLRGNSPILSPSLFSPPHRSSLLLWGEAGKNKVPSVASSFKAGGKRLTRISSSSKMQRRKTDGDVQKVDFIFKAVRILLTAAAFASFAMVSRAFCGLNFLDTLLKNRSSFSACLENLSKSRKTLLLNSALLITSSVLLHFELKGGKFKDDGDDGNDSSTGLQLQMQSNARISEIMDLSTSSQRRDILKTHIVTLLLGGFSSIQRCLESASSVSADLVDNHIVIVPIVIGRNGEVSNFDEEETEAVKLIDENGRIINDSALWELYNLQDKLDFRVGQPHVGLAFSIQNWINFASDELRIAKKTKNEPSEQPLVLLLKEKKAVTCCYGVPVWKQLIAEICLKDSKRSTKKPAITTRFS